MPNKDTSQSVLPPETESVEAVDVGEISNSYTNEADRQAVHEVYERGNEVAAEKNQPAFDNRVGFGGESNTVIRHEESFNQVLSADDSSSSKDTLSNDLNDMSAAAPSIPASELSQSDSVERNNDSTVAPEKSKNEALRGFHGG